MTRTCSLCGYVFTSHYDRVKCLKPECLKEFELMAHRARQKRYTERKAAEKAVREAVIVR